MANRKPDPHKALAAAVKAHKKDADGNVRIYPSQPIGAVSVPGVAAAEQDVSPDRAIELLAYTPAAFSLFESGNPMPEQKALLDAQFEQAWGESEEPEPEPVEAAPAAEQEA